MRMLIFHPIDGSSSKRLDADCTAWLEYKHRVRPSRRSHWEGRAVENLTFRRNMSNLWLPNTKLVSRIDVNSFLITDVVMPVAPRPNDTIKPSGKSITNIYGMRLHYKSALAIHQDALFREHRTIAPSRQRRRRGPGQVIPPGPALSRGSLSQSAS